MEGHSVTATPAGKPSPSAEPQATSPAGKPPPSAEPQGLKKRIENVAPIAISIIALIISLLAYIDQHNANQIASTSAAMAEANKVAFWSTPSTSSAGFALVTVQNDNILPIQNVHILVSATYYGKRVVTIYIFIDPMDTLAPCSNYLINVLQFTSDYAERTEHLEGLSGWGIQALEFTDSSGITWS